MRIVGVIKSSLDSHIESPRLFKHLVSPLRFRIPDGHQDGFWLRFVAASGRKSRSATYSMRLQCAATECDGLMCLAKPKIVSPSLLLTWIFHWQGHCGRPCWGAETGACDSKGTEYRGGSTGPAHEQDRRCHNRVAKPRTNQPDSTDDGGGAHSPS